MPDVKIAPPTNTGDWPELPEKEWIRCRVAGAPVPHLDTKYPKADGSPKERLKFIFQPVDPELEESRIFAFPAQSWHPKSGLVPITQACFSRDLSAEELYELDTDTLAAKELFVMGKYPVAKPGEEPDHRYLKPTDFKRVSTTRAAKAAAAPKPEEQKAEPAPVAATAQTEDLDV